MNWHSGGIKLKNQNIKNECVILKDKKKFLYVIILYINFFENGIEELF